MKFIGVREAQAQLSTLVDQAQTERIVLTRHGQPMALLTGLKGKDFEEVLRARRPGSAKVRSAKAREAVKSKRG